MLIQICKNYANSNGCVTTEGFCRDINQLRSLGIEGNNFRSYKNLCTGVAFAAAIRQAKKPTEKNKIILLVRGTTNPITKIKKANIGIYKDPTCRSIKLENNALNS